MSSVNCSAKFVCWNWRRAELIFIVYCAVMSERAERTSGWFVEVVSYCQCSTVLYWQYGTLSTIRYCTDSTVLYWQYGTVSTVPNCTESTAQTVTLPVQHCNVSTVSYCTDYTYCIDTVTALTLDTMLLHWHYVTVLVLTALRVCYCTGTISVLTLCYFIDTILLYWHYITILTLLLYWQYITIVTLCYCTDNMFLYWQYITLLRACYCSKTILQYWHCYSNDKILLYWHYVTLVTLLL